MAGVDDEDALDVFGQGASRRDLLGDIDRNLPACDDVGGGDGCSVLPKGVGFECPGNGQGSICSHDGAAAESRHELSEVRLDALSGRAHKFAKEQALHFGGGAAIGKQGTQR